MAQPGDGFADHGAADAEFLGQYRLRGQLVATAEGAAVDLLQQLFGNGVCQGSGRDFLEHGRSQVIR